MSHWGVEASDNAAARTAVHGALRPVAPTQGRVVRSSTLVIGWAERSHSASRCRSTRTNDRCALRRREQWSPAWTGSMMAEVFSSCARGGQGRDSHAASPSPAWAVPSQWVIAVRLISSTPFPTRAGASSKVRLRVRSCSTTARIRAAMCGSRGGRRVISMCDLVQRVQRTVVLGGEHLRPVL